MNICLLYVYEQLDAKVLNHYGSILTGSVRGQARLVPQQGRTQHPQAGYSRRGLSEKAGSGLPGHMDKSVLSSEESANVNSTQKAEASEVRPSII